MNHPNDIRSRFDRWSAKPQTGSIAEHGRWVSFAQELRIALDRIYAENLKVVDQTNERIAATNRVFDLHREVARPRLGYLLNRSTGAKGPWIEQRCSECGTVWPCKTITALNYREPSKRAEA